MIIYVPASSEPPSRRWKQKLSVGVVLGAGFAIAAVAISTFDQPGEVAPKATLMPPPVPLPGPSFTSLAPAQVSDASIATPTLHAGERLEPPLPQAAPVARTQLALTQPVTRVEPTVLSHEQRYRPPPSSFMPPLSTPDARVETGVAAGPPQDLPSNMTVLGEGVYQVTSGTPAVAHASPETVGPSEPSISVQAEAQPTGPVNALSADDQGTLPDTGQACGPDWPAQDSAQTEDAATASETTANPAESPTVGPYVRVAPAATMPRPFEWTESTAPEVAEGGEVKALPAQSSLRADTSGVSGATPLPPSATAVRVDEATSGSTSAAAADASMPCKVSVQVGGKPTAGLPIFLVRSDEPAVRLSSLLDLIRADIPAADFQRLRASTSAEAILSIRDLVSAGFTFQVIGDAVAISVTG